MRKGIRRGSQILLVSGLFLIGTGCAIKGDSVDDPNEPAPEYTIEKSISDGAQRTTLAFAGLGMMTGNLEAQSFFPPGKVADYTGFQYLRDNDPDDMGHNTYSAVITDLSVLAPYVDNTDYLFFEPL